ncbi:MAG: nitroreductase family protein [Candidatus Parvarchaeota archaeon]|nr:nitroreductase family protein [Candidatus Jingweiarchaeum tengchongense]MCW1298567.1 nitroreductase family protein [Candidatus Jingweiarchaeum tengchongense]MCW1304590.1 nitroreductase family protein [Candidatus Jingweiarchaeum tengchongense]MCW1310262.1 nitroreductase family protein [Candidatus Jingweiarchaeum tengchongense]
METLEAIKTRRSIRKFLAKPVEEEKLIQILDAARWAPSAGNTQDWMFIVVKDKGKKIQLAEIALGQFWMVNADLFIVVCTNLNKIKFAYGKRGEELYSIQDATAAIQNILLAAHDLGLGACWVGAFDEAGAARILKIPEEFRPLAIIPIGYPAEDPPPPMRIDLDKLVYFDEYGQSWIKRTERTIRTII